METSFWVHDVVSVVDDPVHGRLMRGLLFDASRYEDVQRSIMRKKEAAERAKHAQADYLEKMSHRFQDELRPVQNAANQLIISGLTDSQLEQVKAIRTHTEAQLKLVEELLESIETGRD
jgi:light-regulated signal transduction histidine kinase (bacteriophytochrome)